MKSITSKELKQNMTDIFNQVFYQGQIYTVTRHNREVAVIVSPEVWRFIKGKLTPQELPDSTESDTSEDC